MAPEMQPPAPAIPAISAIRTPENSGNSRNSDVATRHFPGAVHLVTIRPGPVLYVWQDGRQTAAIPLTPSAALCLAADLLRALQALNLKESP